MCIIYVRNFHVGLVFSFSFMMKKNFYDIAPKWNCLKEALKIVYWPLEQRKFHRTIPVDRGTQAFILFSQFSNKFTYFVCIMCWASENSLHGSKTCMQNFRKFSCARFETEKKHPHYIRKFKKIVQRVFLVMQFGAVRMFFSPAPIIFELLTPKT